MSLTSAQYMYKCIGHGPCSCFSGVQSESRMNYDRHNLLKYLLSGHVSGKYGNQAYNHVVLELKNS